MKPHGLSLQSTFNLRASPHPHATTLSQAARAPCPDLEATAAPTLPTPPQPPAQPLPRGQRELLNRRPGQYKFCSELCDPLPWHTEKANDVFPVHEARSNRLPAAPRAVCPAQDSETTLGPVPQQRPLLGRGWGGVGREGLRTLGTHCSTCPSWLASTFTTQAIKQAGDPVLSSVSLPQEGLP